MARKIILENDRFTFKLYLRTLPSGQVYYARFYAKDNKTLLADRSTGEQDEKQANIAAGKLLAQLHLDKIARTKASEFSEKLEGAERLKNMPFADFLVWFWNAETSDYIRDRIDAEKPLSKVYIQNQARYIRDHVTSYLLFKRTALRDITLYCMEQWMRHLKRIIPNSNIIVDVLNATKTPLSWAKKRNMIEEPFEVSAIVKPKEHHQKRGILSREEVAKIAALQVFDVMKPRPRLKDGKKNEDPAPIDIRMKAVVLLSELAALRRGEIRALRWKSVNFDTKRIAIVENYVAMDGFKGPKRDSAGIVPMADELCAVLLELKRVAALFKFDNDEDFVIFNSRRGVPVAESTIKRGFHRALALIGIEDDSTASAEKRLPHPGSQQARRLVLHSGRHGAATRLAEVIGPRNAAKVTRHKSPQAFMGYADHDTDEALEKARKALSVAKQDSQNDKNKGDLPKSSNKW
jgi:integrase